MDGMHDLGGKQGFGKIDYVPGEPVYHSDWDARVHAMASLARKLRLFNIDEYRHAIERMAPTHYLTASYYERVLTGCATLCVEKGLVTVADLTASAGGSFPLSMPLAPGRSNRAEAAALAVGDVVRVRNEHVSGHVRVPGYVRGKTGCVVGKSPPSPFPDASAHAMDAPLEPTYQLKFLSSDLWPGSCEPSSVYVDIFQSYLELVEPASDGVQNAFS